MWMDVNWSSIPDVLTRRTLGQLPLNQGMNGVVVYLIDSASERQLREAEK